DVARVNGQLAISRAFWKQLSRLIKCEQYSYINDGVMSNQEAVDLAIKIKDPQKAAKELAAEALNRESKADTSCIVVRFN
ncbi:Protein phosphatase 2C (PP2C)-like protein, partial [Cynara cardunculus var. scolymus]